jgi:transposase InsO family protein
MSHVRGAPCRLQTQGKIERWHKTLKNKILLENYFYPGDLEAQIQALIEHYNHKRFHDSLKNATPPMPTSTEHPPSSKNAKGSKSTPSKIDACNTAN